MVRTSFSILVNMVRITITILVKMVRIAIYYTSKYDKMLASVAQLDARLTGDQEVTG